MLRKWLCQADVTIEIEPVDPILVKSGYATLDDDAADMVPVQTFRDGESVYYLPGSSLKGVLRSHFERIARTLQPGSVCLPYFDPKRDDILIPVDEEKESFGCAYRSRSGEKDVASAAYADSCAACRLFGSLKFAGRFSIGDAYPATGNRRRPRRAGLLHRRPAPPTGELRNFVGINRFTGGAVPGALFNLKAVVGGRFESLIRLTNFELWQLASINLLLADLKDEMIAVGSGRSRGMGRIRAEVTAFRLSYLQSQPSLEGIGQLATPAEQKEYCLHAWAPEEPVSLAEPTVRGLRREYVMDDWYTQLQSLTPAFEAFLQWHGGPRGEQSRQPTGA